MDSGRLSEKDLHAELGQIVAGLRPGREREDEERALVRLNQKLAAHRDLLPSGAVGPLVMPRSIDDVPILAVTLWSTQYADDDLRSLAAQVRESVAQVPDVSDVTVIGGRTRELRVTIDPARLAAYTVDPLDLQRALGRANTRTRTDGPIVTHRRKSRANC